MKNIYTEKQKALFFFCDGLRFSYWLLRKINFLPTFRAAAWHLHCLADRLELDNLLPKH